MGWQTHCCQSRHSKREEEVYWWLGIPGKEQARLAGRWQEMLVFGDVAVGPLPLVLIHCRTRWSLNHSPARSCGTFRELEPHDPTP